jgi:hypothetical protein
VTSIDPGVNPDKKLIFSNLVPKVL